MFFLIISLISFITISKLLSPTTSTIDALRLLCKHDFMIKVFIYAGKNNTNFRIGETKILFFLLLIFFSVVYWHNSIFIGIFALINTIVFYGKKYKNTGTNLVIGYAHDHR